MAGYLTVELVAGQQFINVHHKEMLGAGGMKDFFMLFSQRLKIFNIGGNISHWFQVLILFVETGFFHSGQKE